MAAYMVQPGVTAAGHISGGHWHPGAIATCPKGPCAPKPKPKPARR